MAPECARDRVYSSKSDVFSYAVTLYEIVTQDEPWKGLTSVQVVMQLLEGKRMEIPKNCPEVLASLMKKFAFYFDTPYVKVLG